MRNIIPREKVPHQGICSPSEMCAKKKGENSMYFMSLIHAVCVCVRVCVHVCDEVCIYMTK